MKSVLKGLLPVLILLIAGSLNVYAQTTSYTYDNLDRLTQAKYSNGTIIDYAYDELGNRTSHIVSGCAVPASAGVISGSATVCQGQSAVTYTVPNILNAASYIWTLPTGATGTSTTNSITVNFGTTSTSGNITVKGKSACGEGAASTFAVTVNPLPANAGTITGTATVCQGQSAVTYTVPVVANAVSYIWVLPTGATGTSTTNSITVNYTNTSVSGNVSVKGKNDCGEGVVSNLAINVNSLPANAGTIAGTQTVCQGQNGLVYTVPSIANATSYVWTLPTGATGTSSTNTITVNYGTTVVSGNLTVKGKNSCGEGSVSTLAVTVNALPAIAGVISGSATVCQGQSAVTYTVPNILNAASYTWTLPTGATGTSTTNSITVNFGTTAASGNITVKGKSACGEGAASTFAVTVNPLPANAGTISGTATVCQGQSAVTYTVPVVANAVSYIWVLPTGATGTSITNSITVNYSNTAVSGNVSVKGKNDCGEGVGSNLAITVNTVPTGVGVISGNASVCQGQNSLTYTVPSSVNATTYLWNLPIGATGTSTTNSIVVNYSTVAISGNISVSAKNACGSSSEKTLSINVATAPAQPGTISGDITGISGNTYTYSVLPVSGAISYTWLYSGSGIITGTGSTITLAPTSSGTLRVVANNGCGSSSESLLNITISGSSYFTVSTLSEPVTGGTTSGGNTFAVGQSCTVTASANNGYTFTNWTEDGKSVSTDISFKFTVEGNRSLIANFTLGSQKVDLKDGLVGYYPFTGNANDLSGNNNNGTVNGATLTTDRFCNTNGAFNFAGVSNPQTIMVPNSASLQFTDAATFSFWISLNSYQGMDGYGNTVTNGNHIIFAKDYDTNGITGIIGSMANGEFNAGVGTGSSLSVGDTVPNSSINQWINLTYLISTSNVSLYANGKLIASKNGTMSFASSNTKNLWFGRLATNWYPFNGKMDDIRIYNRAINTSEIQAIYNLASDIPKNGLIADYSFTGNTNDGSGNGLNGTLMGNVTLTTDRNNNPNSAYYFGGTINDWIEVPNNPLLNVGSNFSVSAWVYKESGSNHYVLGKGRDIDCGSWSLSTPSISVDGSCGIGASNPTELNTSQWYMLTGVMNSNTGKLRYYQDGKLITEVNSNTFTGNNTYSFAIGRHLTLNPASYMDPYGYPFKGKIDDILIYNRVLTDTEILQIYQSSTATSGIPISSATISGPKTVCRGQTSVNYVIPAMPNATSYNWTLPSGATSISTTNTITVSFGASAVSGNIIVNRTNACGSSTTSSIAVTVNVLPASAGTITGISTVCQGQSSVTYTVPVVANAVSYAWALPSGATGISTSNSITVNYSNTAVSGNVSVKGKNDCGEGVVSNLAITVNPLPANAGAIAGTQSVCQGQNGLVYTVPSIANATSYVWTLPTGATGTSSTNTITVNYGTSAVSGNLTVKVKNSCGEGNVSTLAITVNALPAVAGVISGSTTVCQGQSAVTYTVPELLNATSYIWTLPSGATGTSTTKSITVNFGITAASGNITVKGKNTCGEGPASTFAVTVNEKPATPTITLIGSALHSSATTGNQWSNVSGTINGATNQDYIPTVTGDYSVFVSLLGCISAPSNIFILTGIDLPQNNDAIRLYPNPVANELFLEKSGKIEKVKFEIMNSAGQIIYKSSFYQKTAVPTVGLPTGVYLINFEYGQTHEVKKFLKKVE